MGKEIQFGRKEILFTLARYFVYFLQIFRGFVLAYLLGPFVYGIYAYILLYQQYLTFANFGIQYALNAELAINNTSEKAFKKNIVNSAFSLVTIISVFLIIIGLLAYILKFEIFPINDSYKFILILVLIVCLGYYQDIFINLFRSENNLLPIIISDLIISASILLIIPFFRATNLVYAVLYVWIIALILSMYIYKKYLKDAISFNTEYFKILVKAGIPLLLFNFSYNLMSLSTRSIVAKFYSTEIMGLFSFSSSLTTAVMLSLNSITWLIYPAQIKKLSNNDLSEDDIASYLIDFTKKLILVVFLIIFIAILFLPLIFTFLPKYIEVKSTLIIFLLNQIFYNASFGFLSFAISKKQYYKITLISTVTVIIGVLFALVFSLNKLPFYWVAIAQLLSSLLFLNGLIYFISKIIRQPYRILIKGFNYYTQALIIICVILAIYQSYITLLFVLLLYFILKKSEIIIFYYSLKQKYKINKL